jgi:YHS domain-containing protein
LPPPGEIVPPEGLLLPGNPPAQPPTPGGEGPSTPAPGEGLPGLPDLPPEPDVTRPLPPLPAEPPAREPAKPSDASKPKDKATTTPGARALQPGVWRENRQPAVAATDPVARHTWPGDVVSPVGRLEPERNAALSGAYRADSIASAPPDWQTNRVEPAAYATAEQPARASVGQIGDVPHEALDEVVVPPVALSGYCPVELARNGRWVPGDLRWTVVHKGHIYRLSGAQQRQEFLFNPEGFAPVNSGNDPVLWVEQNRSVAGQPAYCATYNGRLYMFSSEESQSRFNSDPHRYAVEK